MADFNEPNIMPEIHILPAGFQAVGAFVSGICDCVALISPLPRKTDTALARQPREQDPQGTLEFPEGFGF